MDQLSKLPQGRGPVLRETDTFTFACHPGVSCFTRCCRNTDMYLYPYDIIRLKTRLGISSGEFLEKHTTAYIRDNPYFPNVMLKMSESENKACPFLTDDGCTVYEDRPFSCRAYPMERAVARYGEAGNREVCYFIARHDYCLGHQEDRQWSIASWMTNQALSDFNAANDAWVDIETLFRANPWGDRGLDSPAIKMAFMACFNVDKLRAFVFDTSFMSRFDVPPERIEKIQTDDTAMMLFGFDWVRFFLTNKGPLKSP
jgi:Fe-S-cluster containining protein